MWGHGKGRCRSLRGVETELCQLAELADPMASAPAGLVMAPGEMPTRYSAS